jgi:hypothetical protein
MLCFVIPVCLKLAIPFTVVAVETVGSAGTWRCRPLARNSDWLSVVCTIELTVCRIHFVSVALVSGNHHVTRIWMVVVIWTVFATFNNIVVAALMRVSIHRVLWVLVSLAVRIRLRWFVLLVPHR